MEYTTTSELFKTNFMEVNPNWNQQDSFPSPIYEYQDEFNNKRVHQRHFSANDSMQQTTNYLTSPSSPFFLQQNLNPLSITREIPSHKIKRRLRFEIILEAATAVTQKAEESAITYLNRGQLYGIQLNDKNASNETITSTLSMAFHSSSHRRVAESYWKFWISQQKHPNPRAIDLDTSQSTGISDLTFPSFDKITFKWNGSYGAKLMVRFKCLSTDFSRVKGVKGIPMRAQMSSQPVEDTQDSEVCFCKVKLFRDKGAERKNKDDAKQISKQLEKVYGKANEQSLPLMYNVSLPYSVMGEIPTPSTLDSFEHATPDELPLLDLKTPTRNHTRVMTAPCHPPKHNKTSKVRKSLSSVLPPFSFQSTSPLSVAISSPIPKEKYDFEEYLQKQQRALAAIPNLCTSDLSESPALMDLQHGIHFDDDLPSLTTDALPTPQTTHTTPRSKFSGNVLDHSFMGTYQPTATSIYDIFTPEEIQAPPSECSITPPSDYGQKDYFNTSMNPISLLQQQLQLHNESASTILSNTENTLLLSPQSSSGKRKKRRRLMEDESNIVPFSDYSPL